MLTEGVGAVGIPIVILTRGGALLAVAPVTAGGVTTVAEVEVIEVTPAPVGAVAGITRVGVVM
jgi:hypothetical protein